MSGSTVTSAVIGSDSTDVAYVTVAGGLLGNQNVFSAVYDVIVVAADDTTTVDFVVVSSRNDVAVSWADALNLIRFAVVSVSGMNDISVTSFNVV